MAECLLEMKEITKIFPGVVALDQVSLSLYPGEVHVLLGENGAGKSTLIKILSGAYQKTEGEIYIEDKKVEINNPLDAFGYGINVIYQEFNLNPYMSIYENIFLGKEYIKSFRLIDKKRLIEETRKITEYVGLNVDPAMLVSKLSIAEKQLVEIAKALAYKSKILVFDEPTATLTETEIEKLFDIIKNLKARGIGIIYISHRIDELKEIGDRCTVLRDGRYISTENLKEVSKQELIKKMVGREIIGKKRDLHINKPSDNFIFEARNICYKSKVRDVSFQLRKGEILGVAGLVGAGRTELAKAIIGEYRKDRGEVLINGKKVDLKTPFHAINNSIVYLSEDRKDEGLFLEHNVKQNITISQLERILEKKLLDKAKEKELCSQLVEELNIKTPDLNTMVLNLSGGNQQKVVIAKGLFQKARVYIFDEPTRGIDVGAKEEIYKIMQKLIKEGSSIIMISSEMPELLRMSDRIMVMREGQLVGLFNNDAGLEQEEILHCALGG